MDVNFDSALDNPSLSCWIKMKIDFSKVQESINKISTLMKVADFRENNKKEKLPEDDSFEGLSNKLENIKDLIGDVKLADNLVDEAEVLKKEFCKSIDNAFYIEKEEKKKARDNGKDLSFGLHIISLTVLSALGLEYVNVTFFEIPFFIFFILAIVFIGGMCSTISSFCICLADFVRKDKSADYEIPFYKRIYIGVIALVLAVSLWTTLEGFPKAIKEYLGF